MIGKYFIWWVDPRSWKTGHYLSQYYSVLKSIFFLFTRSHYSIRASSLYCFPTQISSTSVQCVSMPPPFIVFSVYLVWPPGIFRKPSHFCSESCQHLKPESTNTILLTHCMNGDYDFNPIIAILFEQHLSPALWIGMLAIAKIPLNALFL